MRRRRTFILPRTQSIWKSRLTKHSVLRKHSTSNISSAYRKQNHTRQPARVWSHPRIVNKHVFNMLSSTPAHPTSCFTPLHRLSRTAQLIPQCTRCKDHEQKNKLQSASIPYLPRIAVKKAHFTVLCQYVHFIVSQTIHQPPYMNNPLSRWDFAAKTSRNIHVRHSVCQPSPAQTTRRFLAHHFLHRQNIHFSLWLRQRPISAHPIPQRTRCIHNKQEHAGQSLRISDHQSSPAERFPICISLHRHTLQRA